MTRRSTTAPMTIPVKRPATPSAMKPFKKELEKYKPGKGSIQFPYDKRLPKALIRKIAAFRIKELREKDVRWM